MDFDQQQMAAEYLAAALTSLWPKRLEVLRTQATREGCLVEAMTTDLFSAKDLPYIKERYLDLVLREEPRFIEMTPRSAHEWLKSQGQMYRARALEQAPLLSLIHIAHYGNVCKRLPKAGPYLHLFPLKRMGKKWLFHGLAAGSKGELKTLVFAHKEARANSHLIRLRQLGWFEPPHWLPQGAMKRRSLIRRLEEILEEIGCPYAHTTDFDHYPLNGVWTFGLEDGSGDHGLLEPAAGLKILFKGGEGEKTLLHFIQKISKMSDLELHEEKGAVSGIDCFGMRWNIAKLYEGKVELLHSVERLIALMIEHKKENRI